MASCKNCGIEISVNEEKKYMGMCLTCILFQIKSKRIKPTRLFLVGALFLAIGIFGAIMFPLAIIDGALKLSDLSLVIGGLIISGISLFASVLLAFGGILKVKRAILQRKFTHIRQSN